MKKVWELIKSPGAMALLAIGSICFAIFQQFYERRPEIQVKTETVSSVFNVFQPVGGLQISYAGQDLRSSNQALWVLSAEISNNGTAGIRKADYDSAMPFSISVLGGQMVESPTVTSENTYLQENLKPAATSNRIVFSPVIFEPKDIFRLSMLVLGPAGSVPSLKADGKIAGVQKITYATPDSPNASKSLWQSITQGDTFWIQPLRIIFYTLCAIPAMVIFGLIFVSIVGPYQSLMTKRAKRKRSSLVRNYRQGEDMGWVDRALTEMYVEFGEGVLGEIKKLIDRSDRRSALISRLEPVNNDRELDELIKHSIPFYGSGLRDDLEKRDLLSFDGVRTKWADGVQSALQNICIFLSLDLESIVKKSEREDIVLGSDDWLKITQTPEFLPEHMHVVKTDQ